MRGVVIANGVARGELRVGQLTVALATDEGVLRLQLFQDSGSLDIFGQGGRVAISLAATPPADNRSLALTTPGRRDEDQVAPGVRAAQRLVSNLGSTASGLPR
jgi:hypothetical protein